MEEELGRMGISEEEATPLVLKDVDNNAPRKWSLAGKILYRNILHIQTITNALRPAWGNPKGLVFRSIGENIFVADFEIERDRDRVEEGSPWHVSKHAVILEEFVPCMRPSELKFDKLQVWARVINLPLHLRDDKWGTAIAKQLDKNATGAQIDPMGGYLRARITIDVQKPLRRWILIESEWRKSSDFYDIQYEQIPHFCFSCGRLGHSDLYCPTPGTRDEKGDLPFKASLRASDDWKKSSSTEGQQKSSNASQSNRKDANSSSNGADNYPEVQSPRKVRTGNSYKRKGGPPVQVYRKVQPALLTDGKGADQIEHEHQVSGAERDQDALEGVREIKKKKPTPPSSENSAATAEQRCPSQ